MQPESSAHLRLANAYRASIGRDPQSSRPPFYRILVFVVVALIVIGFIPLGAQKAPLPPAPIEASIGVVRADGLVLPVATLRNKLWRRLSVDNRSYGSQFAPEAHALPFKGWTLFPSGGNRRFFSLTKPATVEFACSRTTAFETTMSTAQRLLGQDTARTSGVAMLGNATVEPAIELVTKSDSISQGVKELVIKTVQALEAASSTSAGAVATRTRYAMF